MVTRRTTMKSRAGTRPRMIREASGKLKEMEKYARAQAADIRDKAAAEIGKTSHELETRFARAREGALKLARRSRKEAVAAAKEAFGEAVVALRRATHRMAKRVVEATAPEKPTAAAKRVVRRASRSFAA